MTDNISNIERNILRLRSALTKNDDATVDREIQSIETDLLHNLAFKQIWDERLLAEALYLLSQVYDSELQHELDDLRRHVETVRLIHDKLCAVLDHNVSLDELLFLHLNEWPQLEEPINCVFDNPIKNQLHEIRSNDQAAKILGNFLGAYFQHLRDQGHNDAVDVLEYSVEHAITGYERIQQWTVQALFATPNGGEVHGLRIHASSSPSETGEIESLDTIDHEMKKAAKRALACVQSIWPQTRRWDFRWEVARDDIPFAGNSIGLALTIGMLSEIEGIDIDSYTAFTGKVEWSTGAVRQIDHLHSKLEAAQVLGIRRVFIPHENTNDITDDDFDLTIIPVNSIGEAKEWLQNQNYEHVNTPLERLAEVKIRELAIVLSAKGIKKTNQEQRQETCKRVTFSDWREEVKIDIFHANSLKPVVLGKDSNLKRIIQETCDTIFGIAPKTETGGSKLITSERSHESYVIRDLEKQHQIEKYILGLGDSVREEENNCIYRARIERSRQTVFVRQFATGRLTIEGHTALFGEINGAIRGFLGIQENLPSETAEKKDRLQKQVQAVQAIDLGEQWIGTDESGKGDYFGPLVGAAVFVNKQLAEQLEKLGIRDSKKLSDKQNHELAEKIQRICGKRAHIVTVSPERYNALYRQFEAEGKNLNTLLAWVHTRALEDILRTFPQDQITVVVDKFADEHYIQSKLLEQGRQTNLNLVQLPKAEVNIAVAAASILARAQFLRWLERLSKQYQVSLPKGASDPRIIQVGQQIVSQYGQGELSKLGKLHFKTTKKILTV